jgi:hypothetical protein
LISTFIVISANHKQIVKRKIQHDAVNNQEDEDSSAYPMYSMSDGRSNKKKKIAVESNPFPLFGKVTGNKDRPARKKNG